MNVETSKKLGLYKQLYPEIIERKEHIQQVKQRKNEFHESIYEKKNKKAKEKRHKK